MLVPSVLMRVLFGQTDTVCGLNNTCLKPIIAGKNHSSPVGPVNPRPHCVFCRCKTQCMRAIKCEGGMYKTSFRCLCIAMMAFVSFFAQGQIVQVTSADWDGLQPLVVSENAVLCTAAAGGENTAGEGLYLTDLNAQILETFHEGLFSKLESGNALFFAYGGTVYRYEQGVMSAVSGTAEVTKLFAPPEGLSDIEYIGLTDSGFLLGADQSTHVIIDREVSGFGYDGVDLFAIGKTSAGRISLDSFELVEWLPFPDNTESVQGAISGSTVILRELAPPAPELGRYIRFDAGTGESAPVTDPSGNELWLPFDMDQATVHDGMIYLTGSGRDPLTGPGWRFGMYAARIEAHTGEALSVPVYSDVNQDPSVKPQIAAAGGHVLVIGAYSEAGVEPYTFRSNNFEPLRDIYLGYGASCSIRQVPLARNGSLFFTATHPQAGLSLWRTRGTRESTRPIGAIPTSRISSGSVTFPVSEGSFAHFLHSNEGEKILYRFDPEAGEIELPAQETNLWDVGYSSVGLNGLYLNSSLTSPPHLGIASDGSVALLDKGLPSMLDYAAMNGSGVWKRELLSLYRAGYVHVHEEDGTRRGSLRFHQNNTSYCAMARDSTTGKMVVAIQHRGTTTYINGLPYVPNFDGYFLVGLHADASIDWIYFLPTAARFFIEQMHYENSDLFMTGAFAGTISVNGNDFTGNNPLRWQAFAARFDVREQSVSWFRMLPRVQSSFLGGAFAILAQPDQNEVYIMAGGSNGAERLNCNPAYSQVQIAKINARSGALVWSNTLVSARGIRPVGLLKTPNGIVYTTGMAYGDLEIEEMHLPKTVETDVNCSTQSFLLGLGAGSGAAVLLKSTDPGTGAMPQSFLPLETGFSVLSLVPEDVIHNHSNGTWSAPLYLQAEQFSPVGKSVASRTYPTGMLTGTQKETLIAENPLNAVPHPRGGYYLAAANLQIGSLDGPTYRQVPELWAMGGTMLLQRRMFEAFPIEYAAVEADITAGLHLYPNPATSTVVIDLSEAEGSFSQLAFYDAMGRMVYHTSVSPLSEVYLLDISNLPAGMYVVAAEGADRRTGKLLVTR